MPLEIKELQIRINVNQPAPEPRSSRASPAAPGNAKDEKERMINQCIEQVLDMINNKKER